MREVVMVRFYLLKLTVCAVSALFWLPLSVPAQSPGEPGPQTSDRAQEYYKLGMARADEGAYEEAVRNLRQAVAIRPDFALAYNDLGYAYYRAGDFEEAARAYQEAIRLKS